MKRPSGVTSGNWKDKYFQMNKVYTFLLATAIVVAAQAQNNSQPDKSKITGTTYPVAGSPVLCSGSANPLSLDIDWKPTLVKKVAEAKHPAPDQENLRQIKEAKLQRKNFKEAAPGSEAKTSFITPEVGPNFAGNTHNGMTPLDNSVAISNSGNIVSVSNHVIACYNTSGTNTYYRDIVTFMPTSFGVSAVCDPVVVYDQRADRFVFFCQEYSTSFTLFNNNRIFICFSKGSNPASDGWWCYAFTGDPSGAGDAYDYSKLAVTDSELYISGNLFYEPANTFHRSVLFQMYKHPGYAGTTLNYLYYTNIAGSPFTVLPVGCGQDLSYGPGAYCVATRSSSGSNIELYKTTANACCSPTLSRWTVSATAYSASGDANQLGSSCTLNTGDCRALSGFFLNNTIHFVTNCDGGSGYTSINYHRVNTSALSSTSSTFGLSGFDYAYPAIASYASSSTDQSVMIGFSRSGSSIRPELRVVNCDNAMSWSGSTLVRSSSTSVDCGSSGSARWGDYSGMSRRHNASSNSVWMSGAFGASNTWDTWIAEIHTPGTGINDMAEAQPKAKVYPNPVYQQFAVEFSLKENINNLSIFITDVTGRVVKELYKSKATIGDNIFSFNKANLAEGVYTLHIISDTKTIHNEKIVIAH
ncbi:MAG: hypothetical protein K0Q79_467 [Flavipsychrobacter sp.]|jgi:hypothetical protein|nr:hypothetical protein [Flavipsychrobacter sp.]